VSSENATVSILLDGEEADLDCVKCKNLILSLEDFTSTDAIIVTYSVTDPASFRKAVHCLSTMRDLANKQPPSALPLGPGLRSKAVILVGNKSDLARMVPNAASKYDKVIETQSQSISVDELLVGALSIRLKARCRHLFKHTPNSHPELRICGTG
ncbi:uncharacterized protein NPIL_360751, partial [Nephila pilipes]